MIETIEAKRVELQARLDSEKSQGERNKLGQFATPPALATQILQHAKHLLPADAKIRFLDPGFGTGSFYSALLRAFPTSHIASAVGFETDAALAKNARSLWGDTAPTMQQTIQPRSFSLICSRPNAASLPVTIGSSYLPTNKLSHIRFPNRSLFRFCQARGICQ